MKAFGTSEYLPKEIQLFSSSSCFPCWYVKSKNVWKNIDIFIFVEVIPELT